MRAPQLINYAVNRLSYNMVSSFSGQAERAVPRSAALMAVFGIGVSSFSVKQMMNSGPRRF